MLRRSQRLCAQPQGCKDGHGPSTQNKRSHKSEESSQHHEEPKPKRHRLTASNLRRHQQESDTDKMGRTRKIPSGSASDRTSITTTDKAFGECLRKNNVVYESSFTEPPDDFERLKTALSKEREVPASAQKRWRRMRLNNRHMAHSELSLESRVIETMLIHHDDDAPDDYSRYRNDAWTEVDNEITVGISDAKPDVTETHLWAAYPEGAKDEFEDLVISQYGYAMPTFAMESKGPAGIPNQAVKQAAYDGAIMTHAALAVDSILGRGPSMKYRKTKAITVTLDDSTVTVYANHAILVEKAGKEETHYHQHKMARVDYMDSETEWNRAHTLLYNAQKLGLRLANLRIKAIKAYFDDKMLPQAELKARQAELQKQARAKTHAAMTAAPQDHELRTNDKTSATHILKKQKPESSSLFCEKTAIPTSPSPRSEGSPTSCDKASIQSPKGLELVSSTPNCEGTLVEKKTMVSSMA